MVIMARVVDSFQKGLDIFMEEVISNNGYCDFCKLPLLKFFFAMERWDQNVIK